jgi:hypothetical protein
MISMIMRLLLSLLPFTALATKTGISRDLGGYGDYCPYHCLYRAKALYYCVREHDSCKDHLDDICDYKDDDDDDDDDDHKVSSLLID